MSVNNKRLPVIFLDRDGVICRENKVITSPDRIEIFSYVKECISKIKKRGYKVIVITNQSGIARGIFKEEDLIKLNNQLEQELCIDHIYYCPHHVNSTIKKYAIKCKCRKPDIGLIEQACEEYNIDLAKSIMVGDRASDIELGHKIGCTTVLLNSGYGIDGLEYSIVYDYYFEDLRDFVNNLDRIKKEQNI